MMGPGFSIQGPWVRSGVGFSDWGNMGIPARIVQTQGITKKGLGVPSKKCPIQRQPDLHKPCPLKLLEGIRESKPFLRAHYR